MTIARAAVLLVHAYIGSTLLTGCDEITVATGDSVTASEVEKFFGKHKVDGNRAVALKKMSLGTVAYLATIHGYPDNLSVCEEIAAPYNENSSLSTIPGEYFCEQLR